MGSKGALSFSLAQVNDNSKAPCFGVSVLAWVRSRRSMEVKAD